MIPGLVTVESEAWESHGNRIKGVKSSEERKMEGSV